MSSLELCCRDQNRVSTSEYAMRGIIPNFKNNRVSVTEYALTYQ
jgi:hypothetical protein